MNRTETGRSSRACRSIMCSTRSLNSARFARPVTASWKAWCWSCSSNALRSDTSRVLRTIPFTFSSCSRFVRRASTCSQKSSRCFMRNSVSPGLASPSRPPDARNCSTPARSSGWIRTVSFVPSSSPASWPSTRSTEGLMYRILESASTTMTTSEEFWTNEENLASLCRMSRISVVSALSSARATCEDRASRESRIARGTLAGPATTSRPWSSSFMNSGAFSTNVESGGMPSELASSASSIGTSYERWDWSRSRFLRGRIDRDTVVPSMRSAPPDAATTWKMSGSCLGRDQQPQPGLVADQRASGLQRRRVDALPVRRRDERRTDVAKRLLAEGGLLLSADQAGHPGRDEDEQEGRRDRDDPQVGRFLAEQLDRANGLRDQRRGSEQDQTRSGEARPLGPARDRRGAASTGGARPHPTGGRTSPIRPRGSPTGRRRAPGRRCTCTRCP